MNTDELKNEEQQGVNTEEQLNQEQSPSLEEQLESLQEQIKTKEDAYLRLYAEFDNFRKRSARERIEQTKTAGRDIIKDFLPVLDDINRAQATIKDATDVTGVKEGVDLIGNKLWAVLSNKGLSVMEEVGQPFDPEIHEAITEIPAPTEEMKGKVVDQVEKGYRLNDVIIRYPKVVVGK